MSLLHRRLARARTDDGFSLLEVLIGSFVALLALTGLAQTLIATMASQGSSERSVVASQLAAQEVERIQALNWDLVTLYDVDAPTPKPATAVVDGATKYLIWSPSQPAPSGRPQYTQATMVNGLPYTIDTRIVWDDSAGPTPAPYTPPAVATEGTRKRIQVQVSWDNRGTIRTVTASSLRSWPPVQRGPSLFYLEEATAGPSEQLIDDNGYPVSTVVEGVPISTVTLAAVTNREAAGVSATWLNRAGAATTLGLSDVSAQLSEPLGRVWQASVGSPTYQLANGATSFQLTATPPAGSGYPTDTRTVSVTFLHNAVYVVPGSISAYRAASPLTTPVFCKDNNTNRLESDVNLDFHVQGFLPSDRAVVTYLSGLSTGTPTVTHVTSSERGTWQRITVPRNTRLTGNLITFTIVVNRTSALPLTGLVQAPVTYTVANNALTPC